MFDWFEFRETRIFRSQIEYGVEFSKYSEAGYDSSNFFLLLGPLLIGVVLYIGFIILKKILSALVFCCKDNFITKIIHKKVPYLLITVRFFLEGCVDIGMSALICIIMMTSENFDQIWEAVSTVFAFIALFLLFWAPFYLIWIIKKYLKEVKETKDREASSFNELFEPFRLNF